MVVGGMCGLMCSDDYCVIGNVLYSVYEGVFKWYDTERRTWRDLQGLVGLPNITRRREFIRLGDYGGKMVVFWVHVIWTYYKKIWCAEISLERRPDTSEIWGKVEWFDELHVSKPLLMPICDVVRSNSHGQVSACGKLESGAVRSGSKDSNESGLHYWNFVLDNGYAIGRTGTVRALRVAPLQGWR
ncbi:hypothetical protein YC2023_034323 [Brassica napus]